MDNLLLAFLVTLFAGLSTGIGSFFAFRKGSNTKFLSFALGLSAGVMIYVSFVDIFPKALDTLNQVFSEDSAYLYTTLGFL